jgi:hypothetical protein
MKLITSHPYYVVTRKIEHDVQLADETEHELQLFSESIICTSKTFRMKNVFDVSYKSLNSHKGFLYLHTHQGLFSFYVKEDPNEFIKAFKKLR